MKKLIYPLIAVLVIALDQFTKYLVRANMQPGDRIPVIGNWMSIYYVQNTGTAFSMFRDNRFVTVFLTAALIIFCIIFIIKEAREGQRLISVLFTFVAAGGISNMIDRLTLGFVTDMISCGSFAEKASPKTRKEMRRNTAVLPATIRKDSRSWEGKANIPPKSRRKTAMPMHA